MAIGTGTAAVIGGIGALAGGAIAAGGARDAADTQADAIVNASGISAQAAAKARLDAINLFTPALSDFATSIQGSIDQLVAGNVTTADLLKQSVSNADAIIAQGSDAAQRAILGLPPAAQQTQGQSTIPPGEQTQAMGAGGQMGQPNAANEAAMRAAGEAIAQDPGTTPDLAAIASTVNNPLTFSGADAAVANNVDAYQGLSGPSIPTPLPDGSVFAEGGIQTVSGDGTMPGYSPSTQVDGSGLVGISTARGDVTTGRDAGIQQQGYALGDISAAKQEALAMLGLGPNGMQGSALAGLSGSAGGGGSGGQAASGIGGAIDKGVLELLAAEGRGLDAINRGTEGAVGELEQFASTGEQALQREAALSGALGPEAQAMALEQFQESPGQRFLRERQEKALLRNSAAIGGLGGGNVRTALQEQAYGIAAQQQQQELENLRSLAAQGFQAAGQQGGYRQQGGIAGGQLIGQLAGQAAGLRGTEAGVAGSLASANISQSGASARLAAQLEYNRQLAGSGIVTGAGSDSAEIRNRISGLHTGAGTQLAGLAQTGGQDQARIIGNTAAAQANLQTGLGSQLAGNNANLSTQIASLLNQAGTGQADLRTQLATILANVGVGAGSEQASLAVQGGSALAAGQLGSANAFNNTLGSIAQGLGNYYGYKQSTQPDTVPST